MEFVWRVFTQLHNARQAGMAPCPISYEAIEAYCRLTGTALMNWQIEAIKTLDKAWLDG